MQIKLVVAEMRVLSDVRNGRRPNNGFYSFLVSLKYRVDDDSGELDLSEDDFKKIWLYSKRGYKAVLLKLFARTLGPDLLGPYAIFK